MVGPSSLRAKTPPLVVADYDYNVESDHMREVEGKTMIGDAYMKVVSFLSMKHMNDSCQNVRESREE